MPMDQLASDEPEIEHLDGAAFPKVSPKRKHAIVQLSLGSLLRTLCRDRGASVGSEWRCRIRDDSDANTSFVPDISIYASARLLALPPEQREEPPFAPDVAAEIRSPYDDARYLERKIARYLETGALVVLDVDPARRTIRVVDRNEDRTFAGNQTVESAAIPWLQFPAAEAFIDLDDRGR